MSDERRFPIQKFGTVPWHIGERAYEKYAAEYGTRQSLERLAERGGFGISEMDKLFPAWRDELSENVKLRAQLTDALRQRDAAVLVRNALNIATDRLEAERDEAMRERDAWIETAQIESENKEFYRGLVIKIGEPFGPPAYTSDDGSVQQDVLALKVPELVSALKSERDNALRQRDEAISEREKWRDGAACLVEANDKIKSERDAAVLVRNALNIATDRLEAERDEAMAKVRRLTIPQTIFKETPEPIDDEDLRLMDAALMPFLLDDLGEDKNKRALLLAKMSMRIAAEKKQRDNAVAQVAVCKGALERALEFAKRVDMLNPTVWAKKERDALRQALSSVGPQAEAMLNGLAAARRWDADLSADCDSPDRDELRACLAPLTASTNPALGGSEQSKEVRMTKDNPHGKHPRMSDVPKDKHGKHDQQAIIHGVKHFLKMHEAGDLEIIPISEADSPDNPGFTRVVFDRKIADGA